MTLVLPMQDGAPPAADPGLTAACGEAPGTICEAVWNATENEALAKAADTIMVGDLIRAIDGPLAPVRCASNSAYEPCADCIDPAHCAVRALMRETREALSGVLDRHSLLTLSQRADREPRERPSTGNLP